MEANDREIVHHGFIEQSAEAYNDLVDYINNLGLDYDVLSEMDEHLRDLKVGISGSLVTSSLKSDIKFKNLDFDD
jgi:predicted double-glycine peptidase